MGKIDDVIACSPRYRKCRKCGKEFLYNFYDNNLDRKNYCWKCRQEMRKNK